MRYKTINGEVIDLSSLSDAEQRIYEEAKRYVEEGAEWTEFANFWIKKAQELKASVDSPIYKLLQDIESRIGVCQGFTRLDDGRSGEVIPLIGEE